MEKITTVKELRQFGLIVGGAFALIGLWPAVIRGGDPKMWALALAALLILPAAVFPIVLRPFHRGWMYIGHVLGWINTRILLGIVFYALITPIGLIRRMFNRDSMGLRFDANADSYRRTRQSRAGSHMRNPF
jgi:hypothetical protein